MKLKLGDKVRFIKEYGKFRGTEVNTVGTVIKSIHNGNLIINTPQLIPSDGWIINPELLKHIVPVNNYIAYSFKNKLVKK